VEGPGTPIALDELDIDALIWGRGTMSPVGEGCFSLAKINLLCETP
jgi:hypothetical protein